MFKYKKINNRGFALVETLVVSVFVMVIFTIIYTNFFPLIGEYERRETYDDIDSIYKTFLVKRMIESSNFTATNQFRSLSSTKPYVLFDMSNSNNCSSLVNSSGVEYCKNLIAETNIDKIVFANYQLTDLKNYVKSHNELGNYLNDYIKTLPYYINTNNNPKDIKYRVIVLYKKILNEESEASKDKAVYSYASIGVDL